MGSFQRAGQYERNGHDILTQKRIHQLLEKVIDELSCQYFRVPTILSSLYPEEYCIQSIDLSNPIYIGMLNTETNYSKYVNEFLMIWKKMWYHGFALYDFHLYLQRNGSIYMLDFDKTAFRMTGTDVLFSVVLPNQEDLFEHPCFPQYFLPRITESSRSESLRVLQNYPYHR